MCFRPPTAGKKPVKCPQCGAVNPGTGKNCLKCKAELTQPDDGKNEDKTE